MATDVQSEYRHIQRGIASTSRNVEGFAGRVVSEVGNPNLVHGCLFCSDVTARQTTGLGNIITTYHKAANTDLSSIQQSTRSLIEQGTREDMSTCLTPKKRVWQYVDEWELTQTRDVVLKTWRQGSGFNAENDTFMAERAPLPAEDTEEEDAKDVEAMVVEPVVLPKQSRSDDLIPDSPIALSVASSTSSTSMPIAPPPTKKTLLKSGLPALGTLTDLPTNVITQRGSRRLR